MRLWLLRWNIRFNPNRTAPLFGEGEEIRVDQYPFKETKALMHDDLKKGMDVSLSRWRRGVIMDNKKGIIRRVEIRETDDWTWDMGDVYVDEILDQLTIIPTYTDDIVLRTPIKISEAHAKQLAKIKGWVV